jgi:hypothetical protein
VGGGSSEGMREPVKGGDEVYQRRMSEHWLRRDMRGE